MLSDAQRASSIFVDEVHCKCNPTSLEHRDVQREELTTGSCLGRIEVFPFAVHRDSTDVKLIRRFATIRVDKTQSRPRAFRRRSRVRIEWILMCVTVKFA